MFNGKLKDFFNGTRGLRQGDPLSHLIFSLVADSLSNYILLAQENNLLQGFDVKGCGDVMPILQYTDDTLIFLNEDKEMAENLRALLIWFEAASGLKVNMTKTKIFRLNNMAAWDEIFQRWNCREETFPDTYLGFPLTAGFKYRPTWNELVDKFRHTWPYGGKGTSPRRVDSFLLNQLYLHFIFSCYISWWCQC